ncbi:pseudouridylate synthase 7 homolog [Plodia interpunctella]|uniref:pseudouridylate synthase 7 homolog n=1 Tax=Plodia interpunctella TaxID=58824 RepID=UPI0023680968|nr:pseudouridylate synthase 7 homolog [Plodia interpunctella]
MNTGQGKFGARKSTWGSVNRGGGWNQGEFRASSRGGFWGRSRGGHKGVPRNNQPWKSKPNRDMPGKRLSEEEIAVTQYMSDHKGFNGIIKSRYSDFQVSEINEKGEVAKLTDLTVPEPPEEDSVDEDEELFSKYNLEILPIETWDNINKLLMTAQPTDEKVEIDVTGMTKEQRTKIHDAVKKAFTDAIVGSTVTVDDKKFVRFERYRKGVRIDNRVKWNWPGEYLYFIVYKENCDTMDAAVRIAERLRLNIKPSMIGYAGTKDRRAKTSQWFSLRKVDPRRAAAASAPGLRLGNYSFGHATLKLGMLRGNQFRIALRNVTADDSVIEHACALLRDRGFVNYYGLQRFGVRRDTPTYVIGRKLLQGNFRDAIELILEEREGELSEALRLYRSSGPQRAARALPRRAGRHIEVRLLKALAKAPNDLLGALNKISRNTRLLYLHSYQSLVWNKAVSERLQKFGKQPVAGDLVPLTKVTNEVFAEELVGGMESDGDDDEAEQKDDQSATATPNTDKSDKDSKTDKVPVKILTQEDIDSGRYTIFDIVLPLPGYNIEYPPNMRDFYEEQLKKDDLTLELRHKIKSYSMSGAYRAVAARAAALRWRAVRYSDAGADLLRSDWDELNQRQLHGIIPDGKYKALLLTMSLPASCYATMALRELLKVDTSCDSQAAQNNYHLAAGHGDKHEENHSEVNKNENGVEKRKMEDEYIMEVKKTKASVGENYSSGNQ